MANDEEARDPNADALARQADREHLRSLGRLRRGRAFRLVALLALAVAFIVFVIRNSQRVPVDFVFYTRQARLIWVMLTCTAAGGVIGFMLGRPGRRFRFHRSGGRERSGEHEARDR